MSLDIAIARYTINAAGLEEIRKFLTAHSKHASAGFDRHALLMWAEDVEDLLEQGQPGTIDLPGYLSVDGQRHEYRISASGLTLTALA